MMHKQIAVLAPLVMLCASSLLAQEGPPSQFERVKVFQPLIGSWQGRFQPPGGPPGTVSAVCRWTSNKSYAQMQWSFQPDGGEEMHVGTVNFGWNGKQQHLMSWSFFPEGIASGKVTVNDHSFAIATEGAVANGQSNSADVKYAFSENELTLTVSNARLGDEELPGYSFTVKRIQPGAEND